MSLPLYTHQEAALERLKTGSILCGGVGSGKSRTALAYYFLKECEGDFDALTMETPKDLYIITTAKKRDSKDWEKELTIFSMCTDKEVSYIKVNVVVDSWNNIIKYTDVKDAFFIFDEQRIVGYNTWAKSFLKISKSNNWILLSATPGDNWMDYVPVFIANGFYKNKTEFVREHVIYSPFSKFPKVDHYVNTGRLIRYRYDILINMTFKRSVLSHREFVVTEYDQLLYKQTIRDRWDPYKQVPIKSANELCYVLRRICNSDQSRLDKLIDICLKKKKVIVFYNFNYELELLKTLNGYDGKIVVTEYNGHKHEEIPNSEYWIYLVQYNAGAEGWECIQTDTLVFYSESYSYKMMVQAAGRIDRLNTPFTDLYYYTFRTTSSIDIAIRKALNGKKNFNESAFYNKLDP